MVTAYRVSALVPDTRSLQEFVSDARRYHPTMPTPADDDDTLLVARCRSGDASAWTALVRRYQRLVHTIVIRAGLDEHHAADVFQTVFERLLQHLPRLVDPSRLRAWIVTCAKREALLAVERGRRNVAMPTDEDGPGALVDQAALPDAILVELEQANRIRDALERIDARCRDLLKLCFAEEDWAYEEIGRRMSMPVGSIGPTRARCLGKLRKAFD